MADEDKPEILGTVNVQMRLSGRIYEECKARREANGSSITKELEQLAVKGLQLERFLAPSGRHALDVAVSILNNDHAGALRKMLEAGMPYATVVTTTENFRANAAQQPKFRTDAD